MGPYRIVKRLGCDRYELVREGASEGPGRTTTAVDLLKPWVTGTGDASGDYPGTDNIAGGPNVGNNIVGENIVAPQTVGNNINSDEEGGFSGFADN